ncbi:sortase [Nocardioides dongkuii]|uniref:sortase n=1 Tax=Nocardioides dongkuii TaxID=2760089 RepID=UPI0015FDA947|nr:sortase [Nocardioides dongkuii]
MRKAIGWTMVASALALLMVLSGQHLLARHRTTEAQVRLLSEVPSTVVAGSSGSVPRARGVDVGDALAVITIPRFGDDWRWAALEGTSTDVLADGPGHYEQTPLPGQRGNSAFAAHRAGHGDPFIDFDLLQAGDRVVLEQGDARWVYELDADPRIIPATADWVLAPTPGRVLTLTTCWPRYGSSKRMYVRGHLVAS